MKIKVTQKVLIAQWRVYEVEVPDDWDLDNLTDEQDDKLNDILCGADEDVTNEYVEDSSIDSIEKLV